jgi:hypothetical protein
MHITSNERRLFKVTTELDDANVSEVEAATKSRPQRLTWDQGKYILAFIALLLMAAVVYIPFAISSLTTAAAASTSERGCVPSAKKVPVRKCCHFHFI